MRIALVAVLLVLVAAILAYQLVPRYFNQAAKVVATTTADQPEAMNPVVGLSINVPRLIEILDQQAATSDHAEELEAKIGRLKKLGLDKLEAAVFPDNKYSALAAVALRGGGDSAIEHILTDDTLLAPYVEKISPGQYRFKNEALTEKEWGDFPVELYRLRLVGDDCIIAPEPLLARLPDGQDPIAYSPALRFAEAVEHEGNVAVLAIRLPKDFSTGWETKIAQHPVMAELPQAKMMTGLAAMLIQQFTEPFKRLEYIALGLRMENNGQRQLRYAQQFRPEVDGAAIYEKLQSRQVEIAPGIVNSMVRLLEDPHLQTDMDFNHNRLRLDIGWHQKDDKPVLEALSQATIGQLFAGAMMKGGEPTQGPVKTIYREAPQLVTHIDQQRLRIQLPQQIGMALFPDHYWQSGDEPNMALELDPVVLANAELADVDYDVMSITSPDGRNIQRPTDQPFKAPLNLAGQYAGRIQLDVAQGTRAEDLGTARLQFKVSVPTDLARFEFTAGLPQNTKKIGHIQAVVERIEKDIAQVSTQGGEGLWVYAFDHTGRAISANESMGSDDSKFVRFSGIIHKLVVVVAAKTLAHTFQVDVDLNKGRKIELTHTPQVPPRIRLDLSPTDKYQTFTAEELAAMRVSWFDGGAKSWSQPGLIIKLPKGPFSGRTNWETHFFGPKSALSMDGTPFTSGDQVGYWVDKEKLKGAHAVFGKVHIKAAAKIESLRFDRREGAATVRQRAGSDQEVELTFNQNEISFRPGEAEVIQIRAYDVRNRRLKMDSYASSQKGTQVRYFWGLPDRVELEVATGHHERTLDFDLRPRPIDKKAYKAFKQEIDQRRIVAQTLRQIYAARRKASKQYGEDLAGFYFLAANTSAPSLEKAAALSDPKGEDRFGYRSRPYHGYHFSVLPKSQSLLAKLDQLRKRKGRSYVYNGQTFTALPARNLVDLAAIPADKTKPTLFIIRGRIYMKHLNGQPLAHVPDNYYGGDWKEVKFVEN